MTDEIDDRGYAALAGFRYELRRFLHFSEEAARSAGLTPQQHQALLVIRAVGDTGVLIGTLADRLILKPHSASELVDRLVQQDLIRRCANPDDRRQVRIALTDHARTVLASLSVCHRDELRRLRPLLQAWLEAL